MQLDPTLPEQLDEHLWVLWRDASAGGREGLLVLLEPCRNPACPCREVNSTGFRLPSTVKSITKEASQLSFTDGADAPYLPAVALDATIHLDTGQVRPLPPSEPGEAQDEEALAWLRGALNEGKLAELRAQVATLKLPMPRDDDWTRQDFSWWEPGQLVGWADQSPSLGILDLDVDGQSYLADDLYCVSPNCQCNQVTIVLDRLDGGKRRTPAGAVLLSLEKLDKPEFDSKGVSRTLLERLWSELSKEQEWLTALSQRQARMKEIGRELHAQFEKHPVSRPKAPGRNDPCPCGSGKKFKKCCLLKLKS